jgi:hypothetical protein
MRFTPKSEKQIQEERFPVLKPGKYHFEIVEATEEVSKKGNPMIVLRLKILDNSFNVLTYLKDYLMESIPYKLRNAAYGCSLGVHYESGELVASSFVGKTGVLDLTIQKDKTGQYPDKNSVNDYLKNDQQREPGQDWDNDMPEPPDWMKNS